jgi:periplasmic divalent cation tolerance protein
LQLCVQIIGAIESTYMWKNKKEISKELLVFIKTKRNLYHKVEKEIKNLHSYENPEIIAIPIIKGNKNYLNWVLNETSE